MRYQVKLNFTRPVLGSQPSSEDLKQEFILKKMLTGRTGMSAEVAMNKVKGELENLKQDGAYQEKIKDLQDANLTVFYRNSEGRVSLSDIQIRGFIKDAFAFVAKEAKILTKKSGEAYSSDEYYRKWIGERIAFIERYFPYSNQDVIIMSRSLRAKTLQGDRICLASSEMIDVPNSVEFVLITTDDIKPEWLNMIFDRGLFKGISQWANAQYGCFTYEIIEFK
jgi:hypothetical protein